MKHRVKVENVIPFALILLTLVPVIAGIVRLLTLEQGGTPNFEDARFVQQPFPIIAHVLSASLFCVMGALQLSPILRRRAPLLHRQLGLYLMSFGTITALSGLWMATFYPIPPGLQGSTLYIGRLIAGNFMVCAIALSLYCITRGNRAGHSAWIIRAYAIAQGAGTQVILVLPITLLYGELIGNARELLLVFAWIINAAIAEKIIRKTHRQGLPLVGPGRR